MEQVPDPFAAEQTYLTENDIKESQAKRKDSYDDMDQDMAGDGQIVSTSLNQAALDGAFEKLKGMQEDKQDNLEGLFDKMQITVMGDGNEEIKSEAADESEDESEAAIEDDMFKEDLNKISKKHEILTSLEERDREDMDFPDEVDTPFKEARIRF
jgi:hypothetical protein